jgi:subtilase family serine protease
MLRLRLALGLAAAAIAAPPPAGAAEHAAPPYGGGWRIDAAPAVAPEATMRFSLALRPQRPDAQAEIERVALRVSDPQSAEYGRHLSGAAIAELAAPSPASVAAVEAWLSGVPGVSYRRTNEFVGVEGPVAALERLLETRFHRVVHSGHSQERVRAGAFRLPGAVERAVAAVFGLHGLPLPPRTPAAATGGWHRPTHPQPVVNVTPSLLMKTYGVTGVSPAAGSKNKQAVAEFQGQCMNQTDLSTFWDMFVMNQVPGATEQDAMVGKYLGKKDQCRGQTEPSLDIQYIMGVSPGITTWFYDQASMDFCADLKSWTQMLLTDEEAPLVNSVSYGWQGNLTQVQCSDEKVASIDADFSKLAAKGISIIFASGDSGSGYTPDCTGVAGTALEGEVLRSIAVPEAMVCCEIAGQIGGKAAGSNPNWQFRSGGGPDSGGSSHRHLRNGPPPKMGNCSIFRQGSVSGTTPDPKTVSGGPAASPNPTIALYPSWPASSPWVTAVGGTRFQDQKQDQPEMATDQFGSGGGFSSFIKQSPDASWQSAAVAKYFTAVNHTTLPPSTSYDPLGRATPDVSALAEGAPCPPLTHNPPPRTFITAGYWPGLCVAPV